MPQTDFSNYQSVFSWRYGSNEMRRLFSEEYKFQTWRKVWLALARAEHEAGLVSEEELSDLEKHQVNIDINRVLEIEQDTKHDVVAALKEFAEKAKVGGGKLHLGATSQDIQDNGETIRNKAALALIEEKLIATLKLFADKISKYADLPCMGYTHLQPAEPTTLGYRFAFYAQDLLIDLNFLQYVTMVIKGKGIKGAVGTAASYQALLQNAPITPSELEASFLRDLDLEAVLISSQVNPRKFDFFILSALSSIALSLSKFAFDLRVMQSPGFGEWSEPFGSKQVGSSAMPFKKNPLNSEKICSLSRYVNALPPIALENASNSLLERTLDDSANKRITLPEAFLSVDEILMTSQKILTGLVINKENINRNLGMYAPFAATELVIIEAVKNGANRQAMHELLRDLSIQAWEVVQAGKDNPMPLLLDEPMLSQFIKPARLKELQNISRHVGDAPERARKLVEQIKLKTGSKQ